MGVLIEIFKDGVVHYSLAKLPPAHKFDVKGSLVEERFKHVKDAAELYKAIPRITPLAMDAFSPVPGRHGMWKLNAMKELEERPKFDWNQLYNLAKTEESMTDSDARIEDTRMEVERLEIKDTSACEAPYSCRLGARPSPWCPRFEWPREMGSGRDCARHFERCSSGPAA